MRKKREEKYITIKEVALEAGVSIATVSRVINNVSVRQEKREKVFVAIEKLNYVPNSSARNLAAVSNTKRMLLILPDLSPSYYLEIIRGFKEIVKVYHYDSVIETFNYEKELFLEVHEKYKSSSEVKGIIQIGDKKEVVNKSITNWNNDYLKVELTGDKTYALYSDDEYLRTFLRENIGKNIKLYKENQKYSRYIAPTIQEALKLYNEGIREDIYTFSNVDEVSKICPNIKKMNIDFYAIGVTLGRISMKSILKEDITPIKIKVNYTT